MTQNPVPMSLLGPGSVVAGRYKLVRRIGRGAMGVVHEAESLEDGKRVALKLMRPDMLSEARAVHRFEREARLSSRLASRHVVQTIAAGVDPSIGAPWIAMELIPHGHLGDWVEARAPVDLAQVSAILQQVFGALSVAHQAGIVHRDLKPENVLVADPGGHGEPPKVKVSDFGVAKGLTEASWSETEAGLGSPLWTSPEQARQGYVPTPRSDVWALGLVSYWLLAGKQYWRAASQSGGMLAIIMEMQQKEYAPPSARAAEQGSADRIPVGFDAWFARAVTQDVAARFADAGEAWSALEGVLRGRAPVPAPKGSAQDEMRRDPRSQSPEPARRPAARRTLVVGVVIVVALLLAGGLALFAR